MTRHPVTPAKPWTDPTEWRDELDDIAAMLREAGRSGPLRDEIATLLAQQGDDGSGAHRECCRAMLDDVVRLTRDLANYADPSTLNYVSGWCQGRKEGL